MAHAGRPKKDAAGEPNREKIISAAVEIIRKDGAEALTVRNVCDWAGVAIGTFYHWFKNRDDLMMTFVRDVQFDLSGCPIPEKDPAGRVTALYMKLIWRYEALGINFMRQFYSTTNSVLSSYMGQSGGTFAEGTVMWECENLLTTAKEKGSLPEGTDVHRLSEDICTIVKGCVFEWCLCEGEMDIENTLKRLLGLLINGIRDSE